MNKKVINMKKLLYRSLFAFAFANGQTKEGQVSKENPIKPLLFGEM
jgi:hypothetical protein